MREINWTKYILAFATTAAIFFSAIFLSNYFSGKKIDELKFIEDKIAMDILASETQFALLKESSCRDIDNSVLSKELNSFSKRLSYMEGSFGIDNPQVVRLKKYYSLLQIKDYLLLKKVGEKCNFPPVFILYFYSNKGDCSDCEKTGYVLTHLRKAYPQLKIYSFDYNLDISTVKTLIDVYGIEDNLPAIVMNRKTHYGFKVLEEMEELLPELKNIEESETATTTENL